MRTLHTLLLAASFTTACAQWQLTTPIKTQSEFEDLCMVSDNVGFAVDRPMGAILHTADGGANWDRPVNNLFNSPLAIHMWDAQRGIVVGNSGSVMLTTDGFQTATSSLNPTYGHLNCVFFLNDTLGWVGTQSGKIYRSTDGGENWTLMASGQPTTNYITAIQFVDEQVGYASCYAGEMLKSTDGGLTWQGVGPFDQLVLVRAIHFYDAQTGVGVGSAGEVIRTTDGGATWDSIPSNTTYTLVDLAVQGDVMVACGWWGRTIRSTDAGLTWTEQNLQYEHYSVALTPSGAGLMGSQGRVFHTTDMGATWTLQREGTLTATLNKMSFANADTGVVVGWTATGVPESGMLRTTDGGRSWTAAPGGGIGVHLLPDGAGSCGGSSGSFARSNDFFTTAFSGNGPDMAIRCTWSFDADTHLVGGGHVNGGIYRTTNAGGVWTRVLDLGNIIISDLYFVNDLLGFAVGEDGDSYRTADGGLTWEPIAAGGGNTVFFVDEDHGWTTNFRTTDGGDTWTPMGGTPQNTVSIFFTDADTGYAVGRSAQTVRTTDGGVTWENVLPDILNATANDAAWSDGAIVIDCNNGDIYRAQVTCPTHAAVPVVTQDDGTLCTTTTGTVQWYLDGEPLIDGDTPCIEAAADGDYHVIVTDAGGCVSAPSAIVQVITTGIDLNAAGTTRLVPNPASDLVRIERADGSQAALALVDAQGRIVQQRSINGTTATIDVSGLEPGVYLVRITTTNGRMETLRAVKQ